jgi:hypothetical protein
MTDRVTLISKIERYGGLLVLLLLALRFIVGTEVNVLLRVSITLLAIYYMWFGFFIFNRAVISDLIDRKKRAAFDPFRTTGSILMGLVYSYALIAIMFAVFFFQGMHFMLGFASLLLAAATGFAAFNQWLKKIDGKYLRQYYLRSAILLALTLSFWLTPLQTRLNIMYRQHPDFIEAYMNYHNNPGDEQAEQYLREVRSRFR